MKKMKKTLYIPDDLIGRTLPAAVSDIKHDFKYALITVDVVLPGDGGILPVTKKIWYMYPSNKEEKDFAIHNKAAINLWRNILEIPTSLTDREFIESVETLSMLDEVSYSLEVVFEKGEKGMPYMKVLSYTVEEKNISTAPIRKKYKLALLDIEKKSADIKLLEARIHNLELSRKNDASCSESEDNTTVADYI